MSVVRRIDDLGRIVIPKEFRNILHLHDGDCIEIDFCNNELRLRKYVPFTYDNENCRLAKNICSMKKATFYDLNHDIISIGSNDSPNNFCSVFNYIERESIVPLLQEGLDDNTYMVYVNDKDRNNNIIHKYIISPVLYDGTLGDTNSNIIGYFVTKYGDYTKEQIEQLIHTLNCILSKY